MSDETEEKEIKVVGEYLQFLREGVQYSLDLQSTLLQILGDFAHDQGHAWDRLMDSCTDSGHMTSPVGLVYAYGIWGVHHRTERTCYDDGSDDRPHHPSPILVGIFSDVP